MKLSICLLFLIGLSTLSCKKYEDGPNFSIRSEKGRLVGKWIVQVAYLSEFTDKPTNGENQTEIWENFSIEFKEDNTYEIKNVNWNLNQRTIENGTWEFTTDLLKIKTSGVRKIFDTENEALISESNKNHKWRIMMLKKKELWAWYQNQVDPPWIYFRLTKTK